ncbi:fungal specific transcription factor domain containing protein [Grosmannia clavigera kw1407]|uniref:Fungal specific transcription factor domain containing protein n=1 Tax=Grosmannia clavigera (strain kw1407 / UAMH 11150) TaxID=655863 RepID=F0XAS4_GROCL|nr:fungal specific transcription factor domain containing protein [Grosmannia clavigera kw1407]EFX06040.1 fungal specific transcription factor domain containing protein [Grosmannia clavigera kw1407]
MACKLCRTRKVKCDQTRPVCQNCQVRSSACTYEGERRKRRWADHQQGGSSDKNTFGGDIMFLSSGPYSSGGEASWPERSLSVSTTTRGPTVATTDNEDCQQHDHESIPPLPAAMKRPSMSTTSSSSVTGPGGSANAGNNLMRNNAVTWRPQRGLGLGEAETLLDGILQSEAEDGADSAEEEARHPAIWMRTSEGDEFTGPSSGITVISDVGVQWLQERVPDSETLCRTIQDIRGELLGHLRQPKCIPRGLPVTPQAARGMDHLSEAQVMRYVDAYFVSVQLIFPVLDRAVFLGQLERNGRNNSDNRDVRPSWLALLSVVLASGCRATLSDETAEAFQTSGREAWLFFQDALFYERSMAHGTTELAAVQALAVMTVFAQGLSSPQRLEYTLCSQAVRQAQALGLNYQPSRAWQLSSAELRERSRVFWAVYCLDKTVALRCGRPAILHDAEISCHFPRGVPVLQTATPSSDSDVLLSSSPFDLFLYFTRLARICGAITRQLYSATAVTAAATRLLFDAQQLLHDLEAWRLAIPTTIQPGRPLGRMREAEQLTHLQVVILHSSYYYVLCAIYRRFSPLFTHHDETSRAAICSRMPAAYVQAARSMVLLTKHLDTESFTPGWLVFYYPLTALTTLFMHVMCNPSDGSSSNDIALMEAVVGLFGRLEYVTSGEAAFTKATEFVRQARSVVDRWHSDLNSGSLPTTHSPSPPRPPTCSLFPEEGFLLSPGQTHEGYNILDPGLAGFLASPPGELPSADWLTNWAGSSQMSAVEMAYF